MLGASLALLLPGFKYTLFGGELGTRGLVTWTRLWGDATLLRHNVAIWDIPESLVFWEAYAMSCVVDEILVSMDLSFPLFFCSGMKNSIPAEVHLTDLWKNRSHVHRVNQSVSLSLSLSLKPGPTGELFPKNSQFLSQRIETL